jgi:hypothetical protein
MERVLELLAEYQWWMYGVLGLILLFYLRRALLARREGARSIFKLEQEQARGRYSRSVTVAAVVLLVMIAIFVVSNPLLTIPTSSVTPEPTATETTGPLAASTLTPTPPPATITPTSTATATRPPRPVQPTDTPEVVVTEAPAVRPPNCPNPNVRITSPGMNQAVQGIMPVRGSANIANFQYYKVEVGPGTSPKDQQWTVIGQLHNTSVGGGVLETLNSGAYAPGTYTLRLVVVDQTGNYPEPCRVTITIQR